MEGNSGVVTSLLVITFWAREVVAWQLAILPDIRSSFPSSSSEIYYVTITDFQPPLDGPVHILHYKTVKSKNYTIKIMDAFQAVLKYLGDQNRPYNAIDIATNLHNEYGKTVVQKSLDKLVDQGKVIVKTYGKQKIYGIKQDSSKSFQDVSNELRDDIDSLIGVLNMKWTQISENPLQVSAEDKERIITDYNKHTKEWRKRKAICMSMVEAILENYPKTKTEFLEEVGIETDESVGMQMTYYHLLPPITNSESEGSFDYDEDTPSLGFSKEITFPHSAFCKPVWTLEKQLCIIGEVEKNPLEKRIDRLAEECDDDSMQDEDWIQLGDSAASVNFEEYVSVDQ
uniref:Homologous-pairing protein 2 homolog n=1 Tax=Timema californicum TaxID=61474 RepID=A0A7R9J5U9_TIMCA|nr:unnamed protein product [Timema californicum]